MSTISTRHRRTPARKKRRLEQSLLDFRPWGGARAGAGRKRRGPRARVPHRRRPPLASRHPVHVTARVREGLPDLREPRARRALEPALVAGAERFGFRLVEYSVQSNHVHMIVEAKGRDALSRGMQGLLVRLARALNRCWGRTGSVFGDRYHGRILRTPREVRHALAYVLCNARKHGVRIARGRPDPCSSGASFGGWRHLAARVARRLPDARTWLLGVGWKRHGGIEIDVVPGPSGGRPRAAAGR